jgi:hypothetical protein
MTISVRRKRATLGAALAALFLAVAGTLSRASAATTATYWTFRSDYNGNCLTGSATTSRVWTSPCDGGPSQQWDWVGTGRTYQNSTYHMLKNRHSGECLMTDFASDRNAVWQSACDGNETGLWWSNDVPYQLDVLSSNNSLRISPASSAVYSSDWYVDEYGYGIPSSTHNWTARVS